MKNKNTILILLSILLTISAGFHIYQQQQIRQLNHQMMQQAHQFPVMMNHLVEVNERINRLTVENATSDDIEDLYLYLRQCIAMNEQALHAVSYYYEVDTQILNHVLLQDVFEMINLLPHNKQLDDETLSSLKEKNQRLSLILNTVYKAGGEPYYQNKFDQIQRYFEELNKQEL
ncbi:hypothetical protein [Pseudalkalibacillus sp. SCS-8]|uniref:hypothetical protein n=1 Tax=Pseudalkalibacillus nanhaiensis TaxID=3115291 RepID=UPI0032DA0BB2